MDGLKLDDSNYLMWIFQFLPILKKNGLLAIVDGIKPCPPKFLPGSDSKGTAELNPDFVMWEKKD